MGAVYMTLIVGAIVGAYMIYLTWEFNTSIMRELDNNTQGADNETINNK